VHRRLENPIVVPYVLSFLAYGSFGAKVEGLNDIPQQDQPDNIELLYYSYHIMAGLGTIFILLMMVAAFLLKNERLYTARWMLWILMFAFPFPYIATTAGWMSAELGRQPWLVYGLQRTSQGVSPYVQGGDIAFTTLGFIGMYFVMGVLFLYLISRELARGPVAAMGPATKSGADAPVHDSDAEVKA
jgi:cytochrome d ubiquinol oxidase subunit I